MSKEKIEWPLIEVPESLFIEADEVIDAASLGIQKKDALRLDVVLTKANQIYKNNRGITAVEAIRRSCNEIKREKMGIKNETV